MENFRKIVFKSKVLGRRVKLRRHSRQRRRVAELELRAPLSPAAHQPNPLEMRLGEIQHVVDEAERLFIEHDGKLTAQLENVDIDFVQNALDLLDLEYPSASIPLGAIPKAALPSPASQTKRFSAWFTRSSKK